MRKQRRTFLSPWVVKALKSWNKSVCLLKLAIKNGVGVKLSIALWGGVGVSCISNSIYQICYAISCLCRLSLFSVKKILSSSSLASFQICKRGFNGPLAVTIRQIIILLIQVSLSDSIFSWVLLSPCVCVSWMYALMAFQTCHLVEQNKPDNI